MTELEEKVARLPAWARERMRELELRAKIALEPVVELRLKVAGLEKALRIKQDRIDAMVAMFQCAAKGGSEVASAVKGIVEDFLTLDGD